MIAWRQNAAALAAGILISTTAGLLVPGTIPAVSASATVIPVGPTRIHKTPKAALAKAPNGSILELDAVSYLDSSFIDQSDVTLRGVNGRPVIKPGTPVAGPDQGLYVPRGRNITFENLELAQSYGDGSQAAIRLRSPGLVTLNNMVIHHSDDCILGGIAGGQLLVQNSTFYSCGTGTGQNHNIYVSVLDKASFVNSNSHGAIIGHLLKSRAVSTEIRGGTYDDTANASLEFDFPEGGDVLIDGVSARKGPDADSSWYIGYGEEVGANIPAPIRSIPHRLLIKNSVFRNEQERSPSGAFLNGGFIVKLGKLFSASMITIENVDLYWPDSRLTYLERELDALRAAGATITNVRIKSLTAAAWPTPPPASVPPGTTTPPPPTGAGLNAEILALGDNQWTKLSMAPSTRILCHGWKVDGVWGATSFIPIVSNQHFPQSRVQSGISYGEVSGSPTLFYFGSGHTPHSCNDVELFDIKIGKWTQKTPPEGPRLFVGNVVSTNGVNQITLDASAPGFDNAFADPNVIAFLSRGSSTGYLPSPGYKISSYRGATRTVTIRGSFTSAIPVPGDFAEITHKDDNDGKAVLQGGDRRIENGFEPLTLSPTGKPVVEHYQDMCKYLPTRTRFICIGHVGTHAFDPVNCAWEYYAGPVVGTINPDPAISFGAMFEYDPDLAAATGTTGIQFINTDHAQFDTNFGKWILKNNNTWAKRGGLPPEIQAISSAPFLTYSKTLRKHVVRFHDSGTFYWYLYDAVSDTWTQLNGMPSPLSYSFAYDDVNNRLIALEQTSAGALQVYAIHVIKNPVSYELMASSGQPVPLSGRSPQRFPSTLVSGHLRYDSIHQALVYLRIDAGAGGTGGATDVWAYRYRAPAGTRPPSPPAASPTLSLSAAPASIISGSSTTLSWSSSDVTSCAASGGWSGPKTISGTQRLSPTSNTTYTLSCTGSHGSTSRSITVTVTAVTPVPPPPPPSPTPPPAPSPSPSPAPGPQGSLSFAQRCALPGVVRCFGFDSQTEVEPYVSGGAAKPRVDSSVKSSGAGSLKMMIAARSLANISGTFAMNFTPHSLNGAATQAYPLQFGEGEEFYVQWRQRFASEFLTRKYAPDSWKQIVIGEGDRTGDPASSCTQLSLVVDNGSHRGFPQMYHSCGGKDGRYERLYDALVLPGRTSPDYKLQNAIEGCLYTSPTSPPCVGYKANQWMTFQVHVKVGRWYKNDQNYHRDSVVELWVAEEGKPSRLVVSKQGYDLANENPAAKYGKVWLVPYNTGMDRDVSYPETYTWYDELIVSRSRIPDPVSGSTITPTPEVSSDQTPPSAPSNLSSTVVNGQVHFAWAPSTDNVRTVAYLVFRDGVPFAASLTTSYTTSAVGPGTYVFTVSAIDAAGNMSAHSRSVTVTLPSTTGTGSSASAGGTISTSLPSGGTATPPPNIGTTSNPPGNPSPPPGSALTFEERCMQPGVIRCFGFDSAAEAAPFIRASGNGKFKPTVDTSLKASGGGSLKMTIPSLSPADSSGAFEMNFTPDSMNQVHAGGDPDKGPGYYSVQFGEGDEFYLQWRQRFTPEFISTHYAGGGGWKTIMVGEGDREGFKASPCTQLELAVNNDGYRGFPQMYHSCGEKDGKYEGLYDPLSPQVTHTSSGDWKLQNAVPGCLYSSPTIPPCVGFKPNEWMTFQMHVKIGTWYKNDKTYHRDSLVELWVAEEGQPSRLVISKQGYDLANQNPAAKYGKVWLLPYNTGKDPNVAYPETHVWYDELIISTTPIRDP